VYVQLIIVRDREIQFIFVDFANGTVFKVTDKIFFMMYCLFRLVSVLCDHMLRSKLTGRRSSE
jgi:hypothetical protein